MKKRIKVTVGGQRQWLLEKLQEQDTIDQWVESMLDNDTKSE
jgi:hypothetical protein